MSSGKLDRNVLSPRKVVKKRQLMKRVIVQEHLDGSIHMVYRDREVLFTQISELPQKSSITPQAQPVPGSRKKYIPPPTHPWRKFNLQSTYDKEVALP